MADFEQASRLKLRFSTAKGSLTVEDLWDLPLTAGRNNGVNLNDLAKTLNRELKDTADEDFVEKTNLHGNAKLQMAFDLVKHVIDVRLAENAAAKAKADAKATKEKILEIIDRKQNAALEGKSLEELQELAKSL